MTEQQSTTSVGTVPPVRDDTGGTAGLAAGLLLGVILVAGLLGFVRAVVRVRSARRRAQDGGATADR